MGQLYDEAVEAFVEAVKSALELVLAKQQGALEEAEEFKDAKRTIEGRARMAARAIRTYYASLRKAATVEEAVAFCARAAAVAIVEIRGRDAFQKTELPQESGSEKAPDKQQATQRAARGMPQPRPFWRGRRER